jgi:hypothetical protein
MTMVHITQEDINKGLPTMSQACAIARGLKRVDVFNKDDLQLVWVNGSEVFQVGDQLYTLPKKAQAFVKKFDADKRTVEPFSFALRKYNGTKYTARPNYMHYAQQSASAWLVKL